MRRLVLALALALALVSPASAANMPGERGFSDRRLDRDVSVALRYWHRMPPCGTPTFYLYDEVNPDQRAMADPVYCRIYFSRSYWRAVKALPSYGRWWRSRMRAQELCVVVLHEWGHLLGLDHSPDEFSLMYSQYGVVPFACRKAWPTPWIPT